MAGKKKQPPQEENNLWIEIVLSLTILVSALMYLGYVDACGAVGRFLCNAFGLFGFLGYVFPLLLFIAVSYGVVNRKNRHAMKRLYYAIGLFFVLCALLQMFRYGTGKGEKLSVCFTQNLAKRDGGGLFGGLIDKALSSVLGTAGTYVVLFVVLVILIMAITEKLLFAYLGKKGKKGYDHIVEKQQLRHQEQLREQEERKKAKVVHLKQPVPERAGAEAVKLKTAEALEKAPALRGSSTEKRKEAFRQMKEASQAAKKRETSRSETEVVQQEASSDVLDFPIFRGSSGTGAADGKNEKKNVKKAPSGSGRKPVEGNAEKPVYEQELEKKFHKTGAWEQEEPALASKPEEQLPSSLDLDFTELDQRIGQISGNFVERQTLQPEIGEAKSITEAKPQTGKSEAITEAKSQTGKSEAITEAKSQTGKSEAIIEAKSQTGEAKAAAETVDAQKGAELEEEVVSYGEEAAAGTEFVPAQRMDDERERRNDSGSFHERAVQAGAAGSEALKKGEVKAETAGAPKSAEASFEKAAKAGSAEASSEKAAKAGSAEASSEKAAEVKPEEAKPYVFPPLDLLERSKNANQSSDSELRETALRLQSTLESFGVKAKINNVSCGPSVTRYEIQPEQGVKVSKITSLSDDIKMNLAATEIRIEAPIPGKNAVGIEVPNTEVSTVSFRELVESREFQESKSKLTFGVGKDIGNQTIIGDIAKMPHMLIAGATGSGKSVCINTLIMSILYKASPEEVKLILIDPKVVELSIYNGIPHLLIPVVTDPKKALGALNWAVAEMSERYNKFSEVGVRDLRGYNQKIQQSPYREDIAHHKMPQIVVIVDEMADLMMVAKGDVEGAIVRLTQLARAAGIHLIIATQRPSVDVITGLIKANVPSRIAFAVSSQVDSRTILDGAGAEKLLGRGDMLFYPREFPKAVRVQGAFVSDDEVTRVVEFIKDQFQDHVYDPEVDAKITESAQAAASPAASSEAPEATEDEVDAYFEEAGRMIIKKGKASIGFLQRVHKIGFNRAARIMDQLCEAGVVGEEQGTKPREILMTLEEFENFLENM